VAELAASCPNPERITSADLTRLTISAPKPSATAEKDLLEAFRVFDRDENGLIALNELRVIFTTLGETIATEEVDSVLGQVSVDDNGKVRYADFIKLIIK
jgi:calmodulin